MPICTLKNMSCCMDILIPSLQYRGVAARQLSYSVAFMQKMAWMDSKCGSKKIMRQSKPWLVRVRLICMLA